VLALPDIVALADGRLLAVYAADDDDSWDTDVVYQIYDNGQWSSPASLSDDTDHPDQAPQVAVRSDGTLTVVWTRIELTRSELESDSITIDEVWAAQDIYYADGTVDEGGALHWTAPAPLSDNAVPDGNANIAYDDLGGTTGLAMWTVADGDNEIAYAAWDGARWADPGTLTANDVGDRSVDVCYVGSDEAVAAWVHDTGGGDLQHVPHFAVWDGSAWVEQGPVPGAPVAEIRAVRVAPLSGGRALCVWAEAAEDGFAVRSAVREADGTWTAVDLAAERGLQLSVNGDDVALAYFHGYRGSEEILCISRDFGNAGASWTSPAPVTDGYEAEWMPAGVFASQDPDADLCVIFVHAPSVDAAAARGPAPAGGVGPLELATFAPGPNPAVLAHTFRLTDPDVSAGLPAQLSVEVANWGHDTSAAGELQFFLGDTQPGSEIGPALPVAPLAPDEQVTVTSGAFEMPAGTWDCYAVLTPTPRDTDPTDNQACVRIGPDATGPSVTSRIPSASVLPSSTREFTFGFDEAVELVQPSDLTLVGKGGATLEPQIATTALDGRWATFLFAGGFAGGQYTLTLRDTITDLAGNPLDGDGDGQPGGNYVVTFYIPFPGDANLDGQVGIADLGALADNYGRIDALWRHGDFNGDRIVGIADLGALADHYGRTVGGARTSAQTGADGDLGSEAATADLVAALVPTASAVLRVGSDAGSTTGDAGLFNGDGPAVSVVPADTPAMADPPSPMIGPSAATGAERGLALALAAPVENGSRRSPIRALDDDMDVLAGPDLEPLPAAPV
jgi:hypothetical protein